MTKEIKVSKEWKKFKKKVRKQERNSITQNSNNTEIVG